jgi:hypothetical protein
MTLPVDFNRVTPAEQIAGEDQKETTLLREMLYRAESCNFQK